MRNVTLVAVVTTPPRPAGRRAELAATPVGERAGVLGLPLLTPARLRDPAIPGNVAVLLVQRAQDEASNAPEPVDRNPNGHEAS